MNLSKPKTYRRRELVWTMYLLGLLALAGEMISLPNTQVWLVFFIIWLISWAVVLTIMLDGHS